MSVSPLAAQNQVKLSFGELPPASDVDTTVLIAKKSFLKEHQDKLTTMLDMAVDVETIQAMVKETGEGSSTTTFCKAQRLTLAAVPDTVTRHNHPWSVHTVTDLVASTATKGSKVRLVFGGVSQTYVAPLASAVAKAFSLYSRKTNGIDKKDDEGETKDESKTLSVSFLDEQDHAVVSDTATLQAASAVAEGVQLAARLVDMTPEELTTDAYAQECRTLAKELGVTMTEIVGEELNEKGYGGIYGVGKAATCPPRLIIMEYNPSDESPPTETVALVGKAIVYDTGGLSLKPKVGMCGMKVDMGGSAGLLGGFCSAVKLKAKQKITLLLCLAENAIGPTAFRNDDILTLYSGKTVEVNNCGT